MGFAQLPEYKVPCSSQSARGVLKSQVTLWRKDLPGKYITTDCDIPWTVEYSQNDFFASTGRLVGL